MRSKIVGRDAIGMQYLPLESFCTIKILFFCAKYPYLGSNQGPPACKAIALTTWPYGQKKISRGRRTAAQEPASSSTPPLRPSNQTYDHCARAHSVAPLHKRVHTSWPTRAHTRRGPLAHVVAPRGGPPQPPPGPRLPTHHRCARSLHSSALSLELSPRPRATHAHAGRPSSATAPPATTLLPPPWPAGAPRARAPRCPRRAEVPPLTPLSAAASAWRPGAASSSSASSTSSSRRLRWFSGCVSIPALPAPATARLVGLH